MTYSIITTNTIKATGKANWGTPAQAENIGLAYKTFYSKLNSLIVSENSAGAVIMLDEQGNTIESKNFTDIYGMLHPEETTA